MRKKIVAILLSVGVIGGAFVGCGKKQELTEGAKNMKKIETETKEVDGKADAYLQPYDNTSNMKRLDVIVKWIRKIITINS